MTDFNIKILQEYLLNISTENYQHRTPLDQVTVSGSGSCFFLRHGVVYDYNEARWHALRHLTATTVVNQCTRHAVGYDRIFLQLQLQLRICIMQIRMQRIMLC